MSSQLQHRLLQFEVEPPPRLWDAISEAMDEQATPAAEKLRTFEATPPVQLWQQIEAGLNSEAEAPFQAVPIRRRYATALRYSSAAAVLLLIALTITFLVNNSGDSNKVAQQAPPTQTPGTAQEVTNREATIRQTEEAEDQASRQPAKDRQSRANSSTTSSGDKEVPASKATQRPANGRYLTVATEAGKPVRLSKKVYPVFDCAEHSSALERFQCQENIEALQKMASSLTSPSGDFASLIDMIKTLEENR
jgi:hypothetical protein